MKAQMILLIPLLFVLSLYCCTTSYTFTPDQFLKEGKVYLVTKGTRSKSGTVAQYFNSNNSDFGHVGIGILQADSFIIYHVTNSKLDALKTERYESFLDIDSGNTYYTSIWLFNSGVSLQIDSILQQFTGSQISYDFAYQLESDSLLYCSEFCVKVLSTVSDYQFVPAKKRLQPPYNILLNRDTLVYYPADFFIDSGLFSCPLKSPFLRFGHFN